jgi:hypothetical protein
MRFVTEPTVPTVAVKNQLQGDERQRDGSAPYSPDITRATAPGARVYRLSSPSSNTQPIEKTSRQNPVTNVGAFTSLEMPRATP